MAAEPKRGVDGDGAGMVERGRQQLDAPVQKDRNVLGGIHARPPRLPETKRAFASRGLPPAALRRGSAPESAREEATRNDTSPPR